MTGGRTWAALVITLLLAPAIAQQFEVVPDTVGIGLQKNHDIVDYDSSDQLRCVTYHLGNPWAANVTGWLVVQGNLSSYFVENRPEVVFVPSGTFRYNSSCCLMPIRACFRFPYVLEDTHFTGRVSSAFRTSNQREFSGTGSATGSSVAYNLKAHIKPLRQLTLSAGQEKCIDFHDGPEHCFSAPAIVPADRTEVVSVDGHDIEVTYQDNLVQLGASSALLLGLGYFYLSRKRKNSGRGNF